MSEDRFITIRLPEEFAIFAEADAAAQGISMQEYLHDALIEELALEGFFVDSVPLVS